MTTVEQTTGPAAAPDEDLVERLARPTDDEVAAMDAWWRANNYLTDRPDLPAGQPAAARAAGARRTSSRGCSATGAPAPACRSSTPTCPG